MTMMQEGLRCRTWVLCAAASLAAACSEAPLPVAEAGLDRTATEGAFVRLDGSQSFDPGGVAAPDQLAMRWAFTALPPGSTATFDDPESRTPGFRVDVAGDYEVALVVTAGGRASAPAFVRIVASACGGHAPRVRSIDRSPAAPGVGIPIELMATVEDEDATTCGLAEAFAYAWSFDALPAGSAAVMNAPSAARLGFVPDVAGVYGVRLVVTDAAGHASAPATAAITVSACGANAPIATSAAATPAAPHVGQPVQLTAAFDDADVSACGLAEQFRYRWAFVSLPPGSAAVLGEPEALAPSFVPDAAGTYTLAVTITDATGRTSEPAVVTLAASSCGSNAPTATPTAMPAASLIGEPVLLDAGAADADNAPGCALAQALSSSWTLVRLPSGSSATLEASTADRPSFVPDVEGTYVAEVVVSDDTGRSSPARRVTITAALCGGNRPVALATATALPSPSAGPGANVTLTLPESCMLVQVDGRSSSDADITTCGLEQTLSFSWHPFAAPTGSEAELSDLGAANPWFVPDQAGTFILRLLASDGALTSTPPATVSVVSPGNTTDYVVDPIGGEFTSLALAPTTARPRVSYSVPGLPRRLRFARCDQYCETRSAVWSLHDVDTGVDFTSLVLSAAGRPRIAYHRPPGSGDVGDLRYAVCVADCDSGTPTWALSTVDAGGVTTTSTNCGGFSGTVTTAVNNGQYVSIAQNATGDPMISYHRRVRVSNTCSGASVVTESLRYAVCTASCDTATPTWALSAVDIAPAGQRRGRYTSIAPGPTGLPRISSYDLTNGDLRYAVCTASCETATPTFVLSTVDSTGDVGLYTSIEVAASGSTKISYHDATNGDLKYASCTAGCTTATPTWNLVVVDAPGTTGLHTSVALDRDGAPQISYFDASNGDLRRAACTSACGDAESPVWALETLDAPGVVGEYASLALTPGARPRVSYFDATNDDLDYYLTCGP